MKTIDLSSLAEWLTEQLHLQVPPEEGHGVQPIIDMINRVTDAHNALVQAVMDYCTFIGYEGHPIIYEAPIQCEHDWKDARNKTVVSGEVCLKCFAIRAGNAASP
jgi:hypothetical protein